MAEVPSTVSDAILLEKQLIEACREGDVDTIKRLVPDQVDVNAYHGQSCHMTLLHIACLSNQLNVVEALLDLKAEVNLKDSINRTPLYIACVFRYVNLVWVLIAHGAEVNVFSNRGQTALHVMCSIGGYDILQALLSEVVSPASASPVDVNVIDKSGKTPLHYACLKGYVDHAILLFSKGAEVHDKEEQEELLRSARAGGHSDMVKYLLQCYPDLK